MWVCQDKKTKRRTSPCSAARGFLSSARTAPPHVSWGGGTARTGPLQPAGVPCTFWEQSPLLGQGRPGSAAPFSPAVARGGSAGGRAPVWFLTAFMCFLWNRRDVTRPLLSPNPFCISRVSSAACPLGAAVGSPGSLLHWQQERWEQGQSPERERRRVLGLEAWDGSSDVPRLETPSEEEARGGR